MNKIFKNSMPAILSVIGLSGSIISILTGLDGLAEQIAVIGIVAFSFSIVFFYLGKYTAKLDIDNLRARNEADLLDTESADYYKDIFFAGPTLAVVAMRHEFFRSVISKGGTIRMIIPDPDTRSVAMRGLLEHWHTTPDGLKAEIQSSLTNLSVFIKSLPVHHKSRIQVKYSSSAPTLSIVMVNSSSDEGRIQLELLPYKTASPNKPHILLSRTSDMRWYALFKEKNEQMWEDATMFNIDQFDIKKLRHVNKTNA